MNQFFVFNKIILAILVLIITDGCSTIFIEKQEVVTTNLEESLMNIHFNLKLIEYIRSGKLNEAIELIDSLNATKLVYIKYYDNYNVDDPSFMKRKAKVLVNLGNEWKCHPEVWNAIYNRSFKKIDDKKEYESFRNGLMQYLGKYVDSNEGRRYCYESQVK